MIHYKVDIEKNGKFVNVGEISGNNFANACFSYSETYLNSESAVPISISMPLSTSKFTPDKTRNYFSGLLPEGFLKESIAQNMHIDANDYLSILLLLGQECLGAIIVYKDEHVKSMAEYTLVNNQQIAELAQEGTSKSISMVQEAHLSLTGASGKVGLYFDEQNNNWYLPKFTAPSTHIVKQSHVRLKHIVTNELLCTKTANKLGIETSEAFVIGEDNKDENVLFATKRYDRKLSKDKICGLYKPYRLHQEDFAQALGINNQNKYESGSNSYFKQMVDLINSYSSDPLRDTEKLWKITIFNLLIGNTDAHIKNFSLLYNSNLSNLQLAPAYDLVSTVLYNESTHNMAFSIGGERHLDNITLDSLISEAKHTNINPAIVKRWFNDIRFSFTDALYESAGEIGPTAVDIANKIANLISCRNLSRG